MNFSVPLGYYLLLLGLTSAVIQKLPDNAKDLAQYRTVQGLQSSVRIFCLAQQF